MKNSLKDGLYENLPIDEYHNDSAIGSSSIKTLATKTALHLKKGERKESAIFDFGSALHLAVLEPHLGHNLIRGPEDRRGKKWTEAKELADAEGKIILTESDYDRVMEARDSVLNNRIVKELLTGNFKTELSVFVTDDDMGMRYKIRPDLVNYDLNIMADLKTCASASAEAFSAAAYKYGYHIQQAFYSEVWNKYTDRTLGKFLFIAVEKEPPYAVAIHEFDNVACMEGVRIMNNCISRLAYYKFNNHWPGYSEDIIKLNLPDYAFKVAEQDQEIPSEDGLA